MTWEETIIFIRNMPEYDELVEKAYFDENLILNVERFKSSIEYAETKKLITKYYPAFAEEKSKGRQKILDIGSGNGISAISFALDGYAVTSVEPDVSETIGAGAIRRLKLHYALQDLEIHETIAEEIRVKDECFDIVYCRQCMHHASDLGKFVKNAYRVLKKGGLFITVRDHVILNQQDKKWFLECHPLQKYYDGENAFTGDEYKSAFRKAGFEMQKELKFYDSVINYYPETKVNLERRVAIENGYRLQSLKKHIGLLANISILQSIYFKYVNNKYGPVLNENHFLGRMYSYVSLKI
jgi:ubiquinone/menaquinone biosynthesis C-methylase UbiE